MDMSSATVDVENVGGIDEAQVEIPPGVTVLAGPNASNKTSLLRALMTVFGSDEASIKGDADEARVELAVDGDAYDRHLERTGASATATGDPYLDDPELADLFAFLLRSNEARRSVERDVDLRELIMRPVDTEAIQNEIQRLQNERDQVDADLDELESLKRRLPDLEQRKSELESEIEATREELEDVEGEIEELDASVEDQREERDELEDRLAELRDVRSELEDVRYEIETKRDRLDSLREERRELEEREDELQAPDVDPEDVEDHIADLRSRKQDLDAEISELQNTIRFNEKMIDEAQEGTHPAVQTTTDGGTASVTDQLLEDDTRTVCWTCGSDVSIDRIEDTVERLRDIRREKVDAVDDIEAELDEYTDRKAEYERTQRNRDQIQTRLARTEREIESTEDAVDRLTERKEDLTEEVERLEGAVEDLESDTYEEVLELHREANDLEYELGQLEGDRDEVVDEIEEIESELDGQDDLEARREEIQDELVDLRTKIDRIEEEAVEEFNDHMEEVLGILDYENIDRIWIEIVEREVQEGRRKVERNSFELHVIRSTDGGVAYEDTVDHLSESEREVTGLVFALAGYLVHDLHEEVPLMVLDALEPIDSDRISRLLEYFESYVDYLVVALLPEDADALEVDHERITDIGG